MPLLSTVSFFDCFISATPYRRNHIFYLYSRIKMHWTWSTYCNDAIFNIKISIALGLAYTSDTADHITMT